MKIKSKEGSDPSLAVKISESLHYCWIEGITTSITMGILDYYLVPYALFLGATTQQVGFLAATPPLFSSIALLFAVKAVHLVGNSRLRLLLSGIGIQCIILMLISILSLFHLSGRPVILISLISIFGVLGTIIGPSWGSLVSDYLPPNQRGLYFGDRSRAIGVTGVLGLCLWGAVLALMKKISISTGFFLVFLGATLFRFASLYYMSKMIDLPLHKSTESDFTFTKFLFRFKESNFVKFIFYVASISFSVQLATPYFNIYLLQELHFNYLTYMMIHLGSVIAGLIAFPIWGRHADLVGNARILKITSFIIPVVPALWLFSANPFYLGVVNALAGFVWSGFNLCTTNFIYDAVSAQKRLRCLGYFNLINGGAIFAGASLGGFLAERVSPLWGSRLLTIFLISAILRFLADFFLSRHFTEVRASTKKVSSTELFFSVVGVRPLEGINTEFEIFPSFRQLMKLRKKSKRTRKTRKTMKKQKQSH
ncbi:MAG: MFS transporter [Candidatus Jettenia sp. CY-1]|nr:MAG: MFS transporter [Candidatus Jettenia sp. CY-1]